MARFILVLMFFIISAAGILGFFQSSYNDVKDYQRLTEKETLKDKVNIPKGMEAKYQQVLQGAVNKTALANSQETEDFTTTTSNKSQDQAKLSAKDQAGMFFNPNQTQQQVTDTTSQGTKYTNVVKKTPQTKDNNKYTKNLIMQLSSSLIKNDHLFADIKIFNNSESHFKSNLRIVCNGISNGQIINVFKWDGFLEVPAKKLVLVKEVDFGFVPFAGEISLECFIKDNQ